ncbi:MAG TPA: phosphoglycolate phosphatase [Eubacteriaceae bacterium]|jgi:phosphoglycolate phosphatase|nr:phosphoglycolate phosphatase [Eubacteriaceae bacterium]
MAFQCVIFDFDGTLADTEERALHIYNSLAEKYSYKSITRDELHKIKHLNIKEIIETVEIPLKKLPKIIKHGQKLLKNEMNSIKPFDDKLDEILLQLKKRVKYIGIITSNSNRNVKAFMKNQNIDSFDFIESSPLMSKEIKINATARKYSIPKSDILYVGDESRDIAACKRAGVKCAAVTWGYNYPEALLKENPDYMIDDLSSLIEIVS